MPAQAPDYTPLSDPNDTGPQRFKDAQSAGPSTAQPDASPPAAPDRGPDVQSKMFDDYRAEAQRGRELMSERNKQVGALTDDILKQRAVARQRGDQLFEQAQRSMQPVEKPPKSTMQADAQQWFAYASLFAMFAGALSHRPLIDSLTAFGGVVQGMKQGSLEKTKQSMDQWEAQTNAALKSNAQMLQNYKLAVEKNEGNAEQQLADLRLVASQWQDKIMESAAAKGDLVQAMQLLDQQRKVQQATEAATQKLLMQKKKFDMQVQEFQKKQQAGNIWSDDTIDQAADVYRQTGRLPQGIGTRESAGAIKGQIIKRARDLDIEEGNDPSTMPERWQKFTGGTQYQRTAGGFAARVEAASNEVAQLVPQALQTSRALPRGQFVPFNRLVQAYQQGTSNPAYNDFIVANFSLINAYTRAMNPTGQPRITERLEQHAIGMLSTATSQQAYEVQVRRLWLEVQASKRAIAQTREGLQEGGQPFPDVPQAGGQARPTAPAQGAPGDHQGMSDEDLMRQLGLPPNATPRMQPSAGPAFEDQLGQTP